MKKILFCLGFILTLSTQFLHAECTTSNATSCQCLTGSSTDCDLLPDLTLANEPLEVLSNNGVVEYSQTGNGVEDGRLRVSASTPNVGRGPLTVLASSTFICGTDTFTSNPGTCPGGGSPRTLINQRIYHKNGNTMTSYLRPAGSMTYHAAHSHMHVDDWGVYSLRRRDSTIADPMLWPMIGEGAKLGFCLMDYGSCSTYAGHCEDSAGNTLLNNDFPNYGLGGGNYNCSPTVQGISSGYTDIYYQYLEGMYIDVPPGTCNGEYYIVVKVDPHNYFLEENENNNVIAIPYTLTEQTPMGTGNATIAITQGGANVCEGTQVELSANNGISYLWNTGDTTQTITTTQPGTFTVDVITQCGQASSAPIAITTIANHINNITADAACEGTPLSLGVDATGDNYWYTSDTASSAIYSGDNYNATAVSSTTYYVESRDTLFGIAGHVGPVDTSIGGGSMYNGDQHQTFDVLRPLILRTVKVYAGSTKSRTIELRNSSGTVIQSRTLSIAQGVQTVALNFAIAPGTEYELGWTASSSPNLWRTSSGANYPYTLSGLIEVTGNSANDLARWYCYYDWQVEEQPVSCVTPRTLVPSVVLPAPAVSLSGLSSQYFDTDSAVTLTGNPTGGTFSGTGVTGDSFDPSVAGAGGPYSITYQYVDSNGCSATAVSQVTVVHDNATGLSSIEGISKVKLYPNPNNGMFQLSLQSANLKTLDIAITNVLGESIYQRNHVSVDLNFITDINLGSVAKGIYSLTLTAGKKQDKYKLIVQ